MTTQTAVTGFRWLRPALGIALISHAFAHAAALVNASSRIAEINGADSAGRAHTRLWLASLLVALAVTALLTGGLGALRVRAFEKRWSALAITGLLASLLFLIIYEPANMIVGVVIGACLLVFAYRLSAAEVIAGAPQERSVLRSNLQRSAVRLGWLVVVAGIAAGIAMRPVFLRWGTRPHEAYYELPGDVLPPGKGFQILHAVNINATPEQVWPWLAQIGHDRAGFYSYPWLENLFGLHIVNADRIVPEWQTRRVGELVPATPHNWLGLVDEPLGWRVTGFAPGQVLILENWGAFALVKIDPTHTRFYIRSQGAAGQEARLWWSPLELLVLEPAHFIMQRKMMLSIKELAENAARQQRSAFLTEPAER